MRLLAGDVGGTKTILALIEDDGGAPRIVEERRFSSTDYPGLAPIVLEFCGSRPPAAACFGVPGAVIDGGCETPNLPWFLREAELAKATGIERVMLLNDFAAAALGILALPSHALATLQPGTPVAHGTKAVVGAGTGLGQALLVWNGSDYNAIATEGGHAEFAPRGDLQRDLAAHLECEFGRVSVERVVSGPGLARIYRFLIERGVPTGNGVRDEAARGDAGAVISAHALAHDDAACEQALEVFVAAYGAEAGNLALRTLAIGGVYIAGGIAPKILSRLTDGGFSRAFRGQGRMRELMTRIPLHIVLEPRVGLLGAARGAAALVGQAFTAGD